MLQAGLMQKPRPLRLGIQGMWLASALMAGLYMLSGIRQYCEEAAIRRVVRTPAEAEGAIEYYNKCLARNKLLRRLIGPEAEYYFDEEGELVPSFYEFPEHANYKGFRDYCQALAEELQKELNKAVPALSLS